MDLLSRIQFESKICPGVTVTFRRASLPTRTAFLDAQAVTRARVREMARLRKPLDDAYQKALDQAKAKAKGEVDALIASENITRAEAEARVMVKPDFPDDQFAELCASIDEQNRVERDGTGVATLRALFVSIAGFTVDGIVPTVDTLIAEAPAELTDELIATADRIAGLSPTERGESPWPGTSPHPGDGAIESTPAGQAAQDAACAQMAESA